jgi:hypothetical protein
LRGVESAIFAGGFSLENAGILLVEIFQTPCIHEEQLSINAHSVTLVCFVENGYEGSCVRKKVVSQL